MIRMRMKSLRRLALEVGQRKTKENKMMMMKMLMRMKRTSIWKSMEFRRRLGM